MLILTRSFIWYKVIRVPTKKVRGVDLQPYTPSSFNNIIFVVGNETI
jgi:hypothetical protein